jgi:hypothetical protein
MFCIKNLWPQLRAWKAKYDFVKKDNHFWFFVKSNRVPINSICYITIAFSREGGMQQRALQFFALFVNLTKNAKTECCASQNIKKYTKK